MAAFSVSVRIEARDVAPQTRTRNYDWADEPVVFLHLTPMAANQVYVVGTPTEVGEVVQRIVAAYEAWAAERAVASEPTEL